VVRRNIFCPCSLSIHPGLDCAHNPPFKDPIDHKKLACGDNP
jgi:hypothetical protein